LSGGGKGEIFMIFELKGILFRNNGFGFVYSIVDSNISPSFGKVEKINSRITIEGEYADPIRAAMLHLLVDLIG
jgi:hypothetical protein